MLVARHGAVTMAASVEESMWTPANTTTALWLDAADESTITLVSDAISQWDDKSGNDRHVRQTSASSRPLQSTLNGLNVLSLNGTGHHMTTFDSTVWGTTFDRQNFTSVCVFEWNGGGGGSDGRRFLYEPFVTSGDDTFTPGLFINSGASPRSIGSTLGRSGDFTFLDSSSSYGTVPLICVDRLNGGNQLFRRVNGSNDGNVTANHSTFPFAGMKIGTHRDANNRWFAGKIAEIIWLPTGNDLELMEEVEGYLAHKWGLTANLPADHPYKTNPPVI